MQVDNETVNKLILDNYDKVYKISKVFAKMSLVPEEEIISNLNEEIWRSIKRYDKTKKVPLEKWLNLRLRNKALDVIKVRGKERTHYERVSSGSDAATFEVAAAINIEEDYINRDQIKTEADKRKLIDFLIQNADSLTTAIVKEYLSSDNPKPTAIGKKIGCHHEVVKRKLRNLAKNFDELQFGEIESYLAV